jgi:hypothetical protein
MLSALSPPPLPFPARRGSTAYLLKNSKFSPENGDFFERGKDFGFLEW